MSVPANNSQSESDDSETERLKEDERKKEEEKKSDIDKASASKPPSGASTKGNNTPSQRPGKAPDASKKTNANKLKRPGSPNLSEASGTESARKKVKKQHNVAQTLQPPSRPTSPTPQPAVAGSEKNNSRPNLANSRKPSASNLAPNALQPKASSPLQRNPAGSGSENEAAGSGDEKSDGARGRIKLKFTSKVTKTKDQNNGSGTAPHSRGGSPDVGSSFSGPESAAKNRAGGFDGDLPSWFIIVLMLTVSLRSEYSAIPNRCRTSRPHSRNWAQGRRALGIFSWPGRGRRTQTKVHEVDAGEYPLRQASQAALAAIEDQRPYQSRRSGCGAAMKHRPLHTAKHWRDGMARHKYMKGLDRTGLELEFEAQVKLIMKTSWRLSLLLLQQPGGVSCS